MRHHNGSYFFKQLHPLPSGGNGWYIYPGLWLPWPRRDDPGPQR